MTTAQHLDELGAAVRRLGETLLTELNVKIIIIAAVIGLLVGLVISFYSNPEVRSKASQSFEAGREAANK